MSGIALSSVVATLCFIAAAVALFVGARQLRPVPIQRPVEKPRARLPGTLLVISAMAWVGLAQQLLEGDGSRELVASELTAEQLAQLPSAAAGIPVDLKSVTAPTAALTTARVATEAEELAEQPHGPDFQRLRQSVLQRLLSNSEFDKPAVPVTIDLSSDEDRHTIQYLVEERPGLLTLIYHRDADAGASAIVYFPTATGDQLVFTPVGGAGTEPVSRLVNSELKQAGIQP